MNAKTDRQQLLEALTKLGWVIDPWGHPVKEQQRANEVRKYRINLKPRVVNIEVRVPPTTAGYSGRWVKVYGAPWSKVQIVDGKVKIGTHVLGAKEK